MTIYIYKLLIIFHLISIPLKIAYHNFFRVLNMGEYKLEMRISEQMLLKNVIKELREIPQKARLKKTSRLVDKLLSDDILRAMLNAANVLLVNYLKYNDHGWNHSCITARNALKILLVLNDAGIKPNIVSHGFGTLDDAAFIVILASFLHDIGNIYHRKLHYLSSVIVSEPIIWNYINEFYHDEDLKKKWLIYAHITNAIFSHDESVQAFTIEASAVKVGDGCDIAAGRSRRPYNLGKVDIHSVSALSIRDVTITRGKEKPLRIQVDMTDPAGIFQVEEVLWPKVKSSLLVDKIEILCTVDGKPIRLSRIIV